MSLKEQIEKLGTYNRPSTGEAWCLGVVAALRAIAERLEDEERRTLNMDFDRLLSEIGDAEELEPLADERESEGHCDTCEGRGFVGHPDDPAGKCRVCNGSGYERESDGDALEDWDPLVVLEEFDRLYLRNTNDEDSLAPKKAISGIKSERARTAAEIERLRARVGELETANERMEGELRAGMPKGKPGRHWAVKNPGSADHFKGLAHAAVVALGRTNEDLAPVDITENITSLQSERDTAIRERDYAMRARDEAKGEVRVLELGRDAAIERACNAEKLFRARTEQADECRVRISELESQLAEAHAEVEEILKRTSKSLTEYRERAEKAEANYCELLKRTMRVEGLHTKAADQLAEVRGMYDGLRKAIWDGVEAPSKILACFPALPPTESKGGEG